MAEWNSRRYRPRTSYPPENQNQQESPLPLLVPAFIPHSHDKNYPLLEKHLPPRMWINNTTYQDCVRKNRQQYFRFHIICYNLLAQYLLEDNTFLYENCFKNNLKWARRRDRLFKEILRQNADIICLQEMQYDHYQQHFRPVLKDQGYESIYLKRSGDKYDGCCIFYKTNCLKLVESREIPFYQRNIRLLDKDNCGLVALFQPLIRNATSEDLFCIATTHLLFSPTRGDIKLAQVQYFLAEMDQISRKDSDTNSHYPIILCGDLNAAPESPLMQFLLSGYIKYDVYRSGEISGQSLERDTNSRAANRFVSSELLPSSFVTSDCRLSTSSNNEVSTFRNRMKERFPLAILTHDKQFNSVYDLNDSTNVTAGVGKEAHVVDYILYTQQDDDQDRLNLLSYFELYKQDQVIDVHMPNHQFPSDHFLLAAKFALKLRRKVEH